MNGTGQGAAGGDADYEFQASGDALPRGAGAEIPQSEIGEGNGSLKYTEQNFNALVAANTALQSELAGAQALLSTVTAERDRAIETAERTLRVAETGQKSLQAAQAEIKELREALDNERTELTYFRDHAVVLEKQLERIKGYTDRVLDEEARIGEPVKVAAPAAPIGPDLGSIAPAQRRARAGRDAMDWSIGELRTARLQPAHEPTRRY